MKSGSSSMLDPQLVGVWGAGMLYMVSSIAMSFVNKATLMEYNLPNTLLLLQMLSAIAIVLPLREARVVAPFPTFCARKARRLLPVTLLYTANVGFALLGLRSLNIPMYNALKRLTPVMVLLIKSCMTRTLPQWQIGCSVVLIVSGCVVAGLGDFTFDPWGYSYALASCVLQTLYLVGVERTGAERDVATTELLYYNALLSLPFIALIMVATGESSLAWPEFVAGADRMGLSTMGALIAFCSVAGIVLNFSLFWCTQLNSALTTTIIGVMKGVIATFLGFFLLGGVKFHPLNVTGIAMNMMGGTWYTAVKFNQRRVRLQRTPSFTPLPGMDLEKAMAAAAAANAAGGGGAGQGQGQGPTAANGAAPSRDGKMGSGTGGGGSGGGGGDDAGGPNGGGVTAPLLRHGGGAGSRVERSRNPK